MLWELDFVKDINCFVSFHPHSVGESVKMNTRVMFEWFLKIKSNINLPLILEFPDFHLDAAHRAGIFRSTSPLTCHLTLRWEVIQRMRASV